MICQKIKKIHIVNTINYSGKLMGLILVIVTLACSTSHKGLFGKKTPHERYRSGPEDAGLFSTELGALWIAAAEQSLGSPVRVSAPYRETGYFEIDPPPAAGYIFSCERGGWASRRQLS
jgi:hypothetical protein